jgi:hypothetical protein
MTLAPVLATYASSRVLRAIRRGDSSPVVAATAAGPFIVKLRGAAHGTASLVAEIVVAELAGIVGLRVPARALIRFDETLASEDRNDELADLLHASLGLNLGFQFLDRARDVSPPDLARLDAGTASRIVWLDWLVMNPDRTTSNPNILVSHEQLWLIDHGSALGFHHNWPSVTEQSPSKPFALERHALAARATQLRETDAALAPLVTRDVLRAALQAVPDDFLCAMAAAGTSAIALTRRREAYVAFLWKRLKTAERPDIRA